MMKNFLVSVHGTPLSICNERSVIRACGRGAGESAGKMLGTGKAIEAAARHAPRASAQQPPLRPAPRTCSQTVWSTCSPWSRHTGLPRFQWSAQNVTCARNRHEGVMPGSRGHGKGRGGGAKGGARGPPALRHGSRQQWCPRGGAQWPRRHQLSPTRRHPVPPAVRAQTNRCVRRVRQRPLARLVQVRRKVEDEQPEANDHRNVRGPPVPLVHPLHVQVTRSLGGLDLRRGV